MSMKNEVLEAILSRRSMRSFTGAEVPTEQLMQIAQAGFAAPSAVNSCPWSVVLVRRRDLLDRLGDALPYAKMLERAGAAFVVCGAPQQAGDVSSRFWVMDCSALSENILLAAHGLGLGAVWTAVHPDARLIAVVREILALPPEVVPLNVIPVGVPSEPPGARERAPLASVLHLDRW